MSEEVSYCLSKPSYELLKSSRRPNKIGIRPVGLVGTAWYSKNFTLKLAIKAKADLEFYQEILEHFDK